MSWALHCPGCGAGLGCDGDGPAQEATCPGCQARWCRAPFAAGHDGAAGGIWQLLRPQDRAAASQGGAGAAPVGRVLPPLEQDRLREELAG